MSVLNIPTDSTSLYYDQLVQLEGLQYLMTFSWSEREGLWYLEFDDQNGNALAVVSVVVDQNLLARFTNTQLPPGLLYAVDMSGTGTDIQEPTDLGSRVLLTYVTSDDPIVTGATVVPAA